MLSWIFAGVMLLVIISSVASASACLRPLTLVVRIMGRRFGTDALSVMTLLVPLVGLELEWVPGVARVSATGGLMPKIRDLGWFRSSRQCPQSPFCWNRWRLDFRSWKTCSQAGFEVRMTCESSKG